MIKAQKVRIIVFAAVSIAALVTVGGSASAARVDDPLPGAHCIGPGYVPANVVDELHANTNWINVGIVNGHIAQWRMSDLQALGAQLKFVTPDSGQWDWICSQLP